MELEQRTGSFSDSLLGCLWSLPRRKTSLFSCIAVVAAVMVWIASSPVASAETIRVALQQQAESITLTSLHGLLIRSNGDEKCIDRFLVRRFIHRRHFVHEFHERTDDRIHAERFQTIRHILQ